MPVKDLTSEQLEAIRGLLIDPLRDAVKAEVELGHGRLRQAVDQLAAQVTAHAQANDRRAADAAQRLGLVETEMGRFSSFRHRVLIVYTCIAAVFSFLWSILRDRVVSRLGK